MHNGSTSTDRPPGFAVDLVEPRVVRALTLTADDTDLILASDADEERFGLRNIALRERRGDIVRFTADGIEFAFKSLERHPLDIVDYVLDARAAARGNILQVTRVPRSWPQQDDADAGSRPVTGRSEPSIALPSDPVDGSIRKRLRSRRRRRLAVTAIVSVAVAVVAGALIGDTVNELSGPGVGDSVDLTGPLVVRDVAGVGSEELMPFSASGPWHLAWENLGPSGTPLTVTAISNTDRTERVVVEGETVTSGNVGPLPSGNYRLLVESDGSWRIVVSVAR